MDIMTLKDIFLVSFPETIITYILVFLILDDIKELSKNKIVFLGKLLVTAAFLAIYQYFMRMLSTSILITSVISTFFYSISLGLFWKSNIRKSVIGGSIAIFSILVSEILTMPIANSIVALTGKEILQIRFLVTLFPRLVELIFILVAIRMKFNFADNYLINASWKNLSHHNVISILTYMGLFMLCTLFNANFTDTYLKLIMHPNTSDIMPKVILNFQISFVQIILFVILTFLLMSRTSKYYEYKEIIERKPEELFQLMLDTVDNYDLHKFEQMLNEHMKEISEEGKHEKSI